MPPASFCYLFTPYKHASLVPINKGEDRFNAITPFGKCLDFTVCIRWWSNAHLFFDASWVNSDSDTMWATTPRRVCHVFLVLWSALLRWRPSIWDSWTRAPRSGQQSQNSWNVWFHEEPRSNYLMCLGVNVKSARSHYFTLYATRNVNLSRRNIWIHQIRRCCLACFTWILLPTCLVSNSHVWSAFKSSSRPHYMYTVVIVIVVYVAMLLG